MPADLTTLANVKGWLNIADTADDALLTRLITAESSWFYKQIAREIITRSYTETINGDDPRIQSDRLELYDWPVVAFTSLTIDGQVIPQGTNAGQVTQTDGWLIEDGRRLILLGSTYVFTPGVQNVVIVYTAGYGASVPSDVEQATIELVSWKYRERDRIGQMSKTVGGETVTFSGASVPSFTASVVEIYRRVQV